MSELAHRTEPQALATLPAPVSDLDKVIQAISHMHGQGASVEAIERFTALYERMTAKQAEQAFGEALAAFQSDCPPIRKNESAKITTKTGAQYGYAYASLDMIADTIRPMLAKHGFSYTWDMEESSGSIVCICTLRHKGGHTQRATFKAPMDTEAKMSGAQKSAAALTYARRQSLVQALGLTTGDGDTDGHVSEYDRPASAETITESQAADLDTAIENVKGDKAAFCRFFGIERLGQLPASRLKEALAMVAKKREALK